MQRLAYHSGRMSKIVVFELDGTIPSKKNNKQIFKNSNTGKPLITSSKNYKAWHQISSYQINLQKSAIKKVKFPIQKCNFIRVTLFYGTNHRSDNTNKVESIHDLLVDTGVLQDDDWKTTGITTQIPEFRERKPGAYIVMEVPTE